MATSNVRRLNSHTPPFRNPAAPESVPAKRVQLSPIPWGKRDPELGRALCRHIVDATPPIVIPVNFLTDFRVRSWLRTHGIHH